MSWLSGSDRRVGFGSQAASTDEEADGAERAKPDALEREASLSGNSQGRRTPKQIAHANHSFARHMMIGGRPASGRLPTTVPRAWQGVNLFCVYV